MTVQLADSAIIASGKYHVDIVQNHLGQNIPLIVEPQCRDTFPAIALAASFLYSIKKMSLDEVVCIMPVDFYAEEEFIRKIIDLERVMDQSGADIALIGVRPSYPADKYGYIVPKSLEKSGANLDYLPVQFFVEKPDQAKAQELIQNNALWNCGVFAFRLNYIISLLSEKGWPVQYDELVKEYEKLPLVSFDYEVIEKAKQIAVIPFNGDWKDMGTWDNLTEQMDTHILGEGIISADSMNTHLINELNIPVMILGLSDIVVAISSDGVLVSDKLASPRVKEWTKDMNLRPMYEEKRWGWYRVLEYSQLHDGQELLTKRIKVEKGKNLSYQSHKMRREIWTVISGQGEFALDGKIFNVKPDDVLHIPSDTKHGIKALTDLEFIEVQIGPRLIEEDIERIYMTWEEVEKNCSKN